MIHFLTTRRHDYTIRGFLDAGGAALAGHVHPVAYEDVLDADPGTLPGGAWIFTDYDRLTADRSQAAARLWRHLAARGCRMLNHPTRSLRRYALLRRLREAGINDFDVGQATDLRAPRRYPVFLRRMDAHSGPASQLLADRAALKRAIEAGSARGWPFESFAVVEFQETRSPDGRYRKYSVMKIGDRLFAIALFRSDHWINKDATEAIWSPEAIAEDADYVASNPFREAAEAAYRLGGIDFGRMDFAVADGRIQVWEINTNPDLNGSSYHFPFRQPGAGAAIGNIVEALRALDTAPAAAGQ
ncbi:MAG: hypothetical protein AB7O45_04855 [Alphaproteobacteria bacterium]